MDSHTSACPNEQVCVAERRGPELRTFLAKAEGIYYSESYERKTECFEAAIRERGTAGSIAPSR